MTSTERAAFFDKVMDALDDMVEVTCEDMRALWLDASHQARRDLVREREAVSLSAELPPHLRARKAPWLSKYRALAGWRHCVVWQGCKDVAEDDDGLRDAYVCMERQYFTPFPRNSSPYYTRRLSEIAGGLPIDTFRERTAVAAFDTICRLQRTLMDREQPDVCEAEPFLALGLKKTLFDVLKLTEHAFTWDQVEEAADDVDTVA